MPVIVLGVGGGPRVMFRFRGTVSSLITTYVGFKSYVFVSSTIMKSLDALNFLIGVD